MKTKMLASGCAAAMAIAAYALDNTVTDDYWDTTGYVNVATASASAATDAAFDSRVEGSTDGAIARFTSYPAATFIVIR